jgi:large conductance mechanosensitive channel
MPPIGMLLGGVDFADLKVVLKAATEEVEAVSINYGAFINTLIDFIIIAFAIFMVIKGINATKKKRARSSSTATTRTFERRSIADRNPRSAGKKIISYPTIKIKAVVKTTAFFFA